jgi:hypothetical protein
VKQGVILLFQDLDHVEYLFHRQRCQPQEGLIMQVQPGALHEGAANFQHLPLTSGQRSGRQQSLFFQHRKHGEYLVQVTADLMLGLCVGTKLRTLLVL